MRIACPSCDVAPDVSATAGSRCRACGAALVARDRKRRTSALDGIVAPPPSSPAIAVTDPLDLPATLDLEVVDLGERTGTAPPRPRPPSVAPAPEPEPLAELAPPPDDAPLELDADWQREKAARQAVPSEGAKRVARDAAMRPPPSSSGVPWLWILVVAAGLCAGGYYLMTRKSAPSTTTRPSISPPRPDAAR